MSLNEIKNPQNSVLHVIVFNSLQRSYAIWRHIFGPSMVQVIVCNLFGAQSLPEPVLTYQLEPQ